MTTNPRVSVLLAVKDGGRWLREALNSILLLQTFTDFELLVVDDGSKDDTRAVLREYQNHPRLCQIAHPAPHGLAASLNELAHLAKGDLLARQDADDVSRADRLGKQVSFMDAHPEVGLLGTWALQIDPAGRPIGEEKWPTEDQALRECLPQHNPFIHSSVMMRRAVFKVAGGYDESFPVAQDYDLWLRMAKITTMAVLAEPLLLRRLHPDQASRKAWPRRWAQVRARTRHAFR